MERADKRTHLDQAFRPAPSTTLAAPYGVCMRTQTPPPLQTLGVDDGEPPPDRTGPGTLRLLLAVIALLFAFVAVGSAVGRSGVNTEGGRPETSLLHELGGPVDVVEQFMSAVSYGQSEIAAGAIAADADSIQFPLLSISPEEIGPTVGMLQDIRASIQMYGCRAGALYREPPAVAVRCWIAYVSDFTRDLETRPLRGTMNFRVGDGTISRVTVDLEPSDRNDLREAFDEWLFDFYAHSPGTTTG